MEMAAVAEERPSVTFSSDGRPSVANIPHKSLPSTGPSIEDDSDDDPKGKRKGSEWAFRPLKIKFKMKEFEKIYDRSIFRQHQQLLINVCALMVILAVLTLLIFLGKRKVRCVHSFFSIYIELLIK